MIPYDWTKIDSSRIRRAKFVPNQHDARGDLIVEFNEGKIHRFKDVPAHKVECMVHNSSPGDYFHKEIRGDYKSVREDG